MVAVLTPITWPRESTQGATGVAGIECGIGLQHIVDLPARLAAQRPAQRAHHARRDRALEAQRVAYRDCQLTHLKLAGIAKGQRRKRSTVNLQHGKVRVRIVTHQIGRALDTIREGRANFRVFLTGSVNHMAVGDHVAVGREQKPGGRTATVSIAFVLEAQMRDRGRHRLHGGDHRAAVGVEERQVRMSVERHGRDVGSPNRLRQRLKAC